MSNLFHLISPLAGSPQIDPSHLDQVVGQEEAVAKLGFFVKSHCPENPFPTILLTGSHGLGKTFLAKKTADALGRKFIAINSSTYDNPNKFVEDVLLKEVMGNDEVTLLLDEAHALSDGLTSLLLTLLAPSEEDDEYVKYKGSRFFYDKSKINVMFATTDAHKIFTALINRCEQVYLYPYTDYEIGQILSMYVNGNIRMEFPNSKTSEILDELYVSCRGRARDTFLMADRINRYCKMQNTDVFDENAWNDLRSIFGIMPLGLTKQELNLLKVISHNQPISAKGLALKLMVNQHNIEDELEVRLKELGLVKNTTKGRILDKKGVEYIEAHYV